MIRFSTEAFLGNLMIEAHDRGLMMAVLTVSGFATILPRT